MQLWTAFAHTGVVGKAVLGVLLLFSIFSWATMIVVWGRFRRSHAASRRFVTQFRKAKRLVDVQSVLGQMKYSALVGLFKAGYAEIEAQIAHSATTQSIRSLDAVERSLMRASRIETARLSRFVPFLATTAAATPFIGLFGTVWGIMESFANIGATGSTSITAVAPGISEALINTAAGLFAAVPALLAYNYFVQQLRRARGEMEDFTLEFLNLTERNFTSRRLTLDMAFRFSDSDDLGDMAEINVTPLVDVMLVLLVIFMVTAPLLTQGLEVQLPHAEGRSFELASNNPTKIVVAANGAVYVDGTAVGSRDLPMTLGTMLRARRVKRALLEADRSVPYGRVVAVLDVMNRAGVEQLGMVTQPREADARPGR